MNTTVHFTWIDSETDVAHEIEADVYIPLVERADDYADVEVRGATVEGVAVSIDFVGELSATRWETLSGMAIDAANDQRAG